MVKGLRYTTPAAKTNVTAKKNKVFLRYFSPAKNGEMRERISMIAKTRYFLPVIISE